MPDLVKDMPGFGLEDLEKVAIEIISFGEGYNIWIFVGDMGVGKTTLIKEVCRLLGISDNVHSPTYSLVNEYEGPNKRIFYHFDFYRLQSEAEAMDIGIEEYFYSGNTCFIEWPERILSLLPLRYIKIAVTLADKDKRSIFLSKHDE